MRLTAELGAEYQQLFDSCTVSPADVSAVDAIADRVLKNRKRYQAVGDRVTTPWYVVARSTTSRPARTSPSTCTTATR